jgi:hypothetical protein
MGTFTVIEYAGLGVEGGKPIQVAHEPANTEQTAITTSGTSQQSAAFNAGTSIVLVQTTSIVRFKVGSSPTASATTSRRLAADEEVYFHVTPGTALKVAVIDAS